MILWITENIGTLLSALALIGVVIAAVFAIRRDRKDGKSSCGCGCAHCAMAGACHKAK